MNADVFAQWLVRQGHTVWRTASSYWHSNGCRVLQAFPYHWVISPDEFELRAFLRANRSLGLRYSTSVSKPIGARSYHAVLDPCVYGMDTLSKWARKNVKRGISRCDIVPVSFDRLAAEGWPLQADTLDRQGRLVNIDREKWETRCLAANGLPGFEAWAAIANGRLAASVITAQIEGWCYMLYQQCHRDFLPDHVNNALAFRVTETMMNERRVSGILYGLHSLDAPPSVDEFKFRMGYRAKPVRQRVVFHPWIGPAVNPVLHSVIRGLKRALPGQVTLSKAEGMVRFYLEGLHGAFLGSGPRPGHDSLVVPGCDPVPMPDTNAGRLGE